MRTHHDMHKIKFAISLNISFKQINLQSQRMNTSIPNSSWIGCLNSWIDDAIKFKCSIIGLCKRNVHIAENIASTKHPIDFNVYA